MSTTVIGLDPGSERTGYAVFRVTGRPPDTVSTILQEASRKDNEEVLACLATLPLLEGYRVVIEKPWIEPGRVYPAALENLRWASKFEGIVEGRAYGVKGVGCLRVNMIQSNVARQWLIPLASRKIDAAGKRKGPTDKEIRLAVEARLGRTLDVPYEDARHVADACVVALMSIEANRSTMQ